jgi:hypothetical protein
MGSPEFAIQFSPDVPIFGCVPSGYHYKLYIKLTNVSPIPEKLKISCVRGDDEPNVIRFNYLPILLAPGMAKTIMIELDGVYERTSKYELYVTLSDRTRLRREIVVHVIDEMKYKTLASGLRVMNRKPYTDGIVVAGRLESADNLSDADTLFSTALIDDDDIEV